MDKGSIYGAVKYLSSEAPIKSTSVKSFINCVGEGITGIAKTVCMNFNKLISSLCPSELHVPWKKSLNDSDYKYLNFWANYEIKIKGSFENVFIDAFSNNVSSEMGQCFNKNKFVGALKYLEKSCMDKLKTIDNLYRNYYDMGDIIFSSTDNFEECLEYSKNCFREYKKVIGTDQYRDKHFYDSLINFKKTYEQLAHKALSKNISYAEYIVKMPEYMYSFG
ncbi:hypothetical protein PVT01_000107000 [Plasmodium vivax]|uniref:PIR Superfamily Protein n=1 Tax=Plasmodium vivax TaxID=5855 RepID=A0A1G4E3X5_PLAVI|nr:hypothetical protein PVT01_000107000 [Plasmodium vivax]